MPLVPPPEGNECPDAYYWTGLSGGSRLEVDAAQRIKQGMEVFGIGNGGFWYLAIALNAGASFPELIFVGTDERGLHVLLESHVRLTAHFLPPDLHSPTSPGDRWDTHRVLTGSDARPCTLAAAPPPGRESARR